MHYTAKLAAEQAADLLEEQEWKLSVEQSEAEWPDQFDAKDLPPLNIPRRDGKKVAPASLSAPLPSVYPCSHLHLNLCYVWDWHTCPSNRCQTTPEQHGGCVMMLACLLLF